jgi:hypothetical protein
VIFYFPPLRFWRLPYPSVKKVNAKDKNLRIENFLLDTGGMKNKRKGIVLGIQKSKRKG